MNPNTVAEISAQTLALQAESAQTYAAALKAAGDTLRMQILAVLACDSFGVLELCDIFGSKQSGMSHHLKVLARADFVSTRREGNTIFYHRSNNKLSPGLESLRNTIFNCAETLELDAELKENLDSVYQLRSAASRKFFLNNAEAFKSQQELIASFDVYASEVAELIDQSSFPAKDQALEIGPGLGDFLGRLSSRFSDVFALDNSEQMLRQASAHCAKEKLDNIDFIRGDTALCHDWPEKFDCAVINMVLHHTPSPHQIFKDVAASLKNAASLFVCDLSAHDQDWVKEACGDQWLGFEAEELKHWAQNAKLFSHESRYLSLRNGFQIQIHHFIKKH